LEGHGFLLFAGAPNCPVAHRIALVQRPPKRLIGRLPFQVGTRLSGGIPDMFGGPPNHCPTDVADTDCTTEHWCCRAGEESLAAWRTGYVRCTPSGILNQRALVFSRERPVGQLTRSGTGLFSEAQPGPTLSTFEPNFLTHFLLDLKSSLTLR
jgi:hypothetical protein